MRVFVVGTGRCGSTTFAAALRHVTNYTVAHESHAGQPFSLEYPDRHIEVDPPLAFSLHRLRRQYPEARFVHLYRADRDACIRSIAKNDSRIAAEFGRMLTHGEVSAIDGAELLYDAITNFCRTFPGIFNCRLESIKSQWRHCWKFMECDGDYEASLREWDAYHNRSA